MARKTAANKSKKKDNSLRNAGIAFIAAFAISTLLGFNWIVGGLISLGVASLIKVMTAPMKGLDAPKSSAGITPENVQDEYARDMIVTGLELLESLRKERDAISEHVFTRRINAFAEGFTDLLNRVVADADKATYLRKLNSYYVPTLLKLLESYRNAKGQGTSYMQISKTREDLLKTLDQLIDTTGVLKEKMVQANLESMDIKIEVLEDILRADGYLESEESAELRQSAAQAVASMPTASAQQLNQGAPVLHVPGLFDTTEPSADNKRSAAN